ncbi:MAG TPA: hypothetical protein VFF65_05690 [Phycisphaerales bacterium]|nr:hypothetical protein [Phycisphaerales bacterium]
MRAKWQQPPVAVRWVALAVATVAALVLLLPKGTSTYGWADSATDSTGKNWQFAGRTHIVKGHWMPLWEQDEVAWQPSPGPTLPGPLLFTSTPGWPPGDYVLSRWKILEAEAAAGRIYTSGGGPNWLGIASHAAVAAAVWGGAMLSFTFLLPLMWKQPGTCPNCAYPRTGLKPGAVCPECGRSAADTA